MRKMRGLGNVPRGFQVNKSPSLFSFSLSPQGNDVFPFKGLVQHIQLQGTSSGDFVRISTSRGASVYCRCCSLRTGGCGVSDIDGSEAGVVVEGEGEDQAHPHPHASRDIDAVFEVHGAADEQRQEYDGGYPRSPKPKDCG
jgi:hypothetical protein